MPSHLSLIRPGHLLQLSDKSERPNLITESPYEFIEIMGLALFGVGRCSRALPIPCFPRWQYSGGTAEEYHKSNSPCRHKDSKANPQYPSPIASPTEQIEYLATGL